MKTTTKFATIVSAFVFLIFALSGCAITTHTNESIDNPLVISDVWVKAVPDLAADKSMTAMFMTVENPSGTDIYITGGAADSELTDMAVEAHEVVMDSAGEMTMQKTENGILIPAHSTIQLQPGGFHIMLMMLKKPIIVGDEVTVNLTLSNGGSVAVTGIAMTLDGGSEKYVPSK